VGSNLRQRVRCKEFTLFDAVVGDDPNIKI
jgi:hypothetical protein